MKKLKKLLTNNYYWYIMLLTVNFKEVKRLLNVTIENEKAKAIQFYEEFSKLPESEQDFIRGYIHGKLDACTDTNEQKTA